MWRLVSILLISIANLLPGQAAYSMESSVGKLQLTAMVNGLKAPWAFAFLPNGDILITEKRGNLLYVNANGKRHRVQGLPSVHVQGQGGLLDVIVARDFVSSRRIFVSFVTKQSGGAGTAVLSAVLSKDGRKLENVSRIFEMNAGSSGGRHFGSRLVQANDGNLFVTVGERGDRPAAQEISRHEGSVVRISTEGKAPQGNPFLGKDTAQPEIWSFGHRNPQGLALDLKGGLWAVEHGAKGGDEINRIIKGRNYGWPTISFGTHYSGAKIGIGTEQQGMEQPAFYWDPSIAPSGMMIYSGKLWPQWRGHFFVGSLKLDFISRLAGVPLQERERLSGAQTKRVRDVREGPNGGIWFLSEDKGTLYRITPAM